MNDLPTEIPADVAELLAGYVLGALTPTEQTTVETYLAHHPAARQYLAKLQTTWELLPLALPDAQPPEALRERVMAAAASVDLAPSQPHLRSRILWITALGGAIALALGGLGWQNHRLQQQIATLQQQNTQLAQQSQGYSQQLQAAQRETQDLLEQSGNRLIPIKSMVDRSTATGSLLMAPAKSIALLHLKQVPKLPQGKVYRIWAILDSGEMACGDFTPSGEGTVSMKLPLMADWQKAKEIAITIEDPKAKDAEGPEVMGGGVI